jgi:hypothetical protein
MTDVTVVNELGEDAEFNELNSLINKADALLAAAEGLEDGPDKEQLVEAIEAQRVSLEGIAVMHQDLFG